MIMRPLIVATGTVVLGALCCGCVGSDRPDAAATPTSPSPSPAAPTIGAADAPSTSSAPAGGGLFIPSPTAPAATLAAAPSPTVVPTIVFAVPPLPADLQMVRPAAPQPPADTDHDHDHDGPVADDAVASMWVAAVYTGRYDDPLDALVAALAALATEELAHATAATAAPFDDDVFEVRWPVVTATTATADGWWQVTFVIKRTAAGQVGPSTSDPLTVEVHVTDGVVDDWRPAS